jgi:hypothetical protein
MDDIIIIVESIIVIEFVLAESTVNDGVLMSIV